MATAVIGILAAGGVRDLLVIHIPMALITMALAARLAGVARRPG